MTIWKLLYKAKKKKKKKKKKKGLNKSQKLITDNGLSKKFEYY